MTSAELSELVTRLSILTGLPRDKIKREYLGTIKRLARAEFDSVTVCVMVRALIETHNAYDKWQARQAKPGAVQAIKRIFRRWGSS
jgi:uncharacterized protein (DUF2132 family)